MQLHQQLILWAVAALCAAQLYVTVDEAIQAAKPPELPFEIEKGDVYLDDSPRGAYYFDGESWRSIKERPDGSIAIGKRVG